MIRAGWCLRKVGAMGRLVLKVGWCLIKVTI